ncbi:phosphotransferase family protein [Rhodococcus sp. NPDC059968]|uniref:phosphotransferase family protein n=1 Tax=Rhodococcus sp. NPDC059968 TaxID=3347017 RepID=UPI00366D446A
MDSRNLPGQGEAIQLRFISGGTQNEIYELRRGSLRCALRKPPTNAPASRDEGILREWRIINSLEGTDVPHPAAIAVCHDPSVLDRCFYLMGFVDGWSPISSPRWPEPFNSDIEARKGLAYELVEGVVRMGRFDWRAHGLHDLGRPDGFHDRQVERWTAFHNRSKGRPVPGIDEATRWLAAHRPLDFSPGLMHGDYQFGNVMFQHGAPARLTAIVDWEMATIGDPKLDLAWALQRWPDDTTAPEPGGDHLDLTGMPTYSDLLEYYARNSGRQVDDFDYYLILARWKLAIVLEQGFQRAGEDEKLLSFEPLVLDLMRRAADLAESTDYSGSAH